MTNFFQRPQILQQPNPEPPGYDLIRQALMDRFFQQMENPYGLNPQYLQTGPAGNMINPPGGMGSAGGGGAFNPYDSSVYGQMGMGGGLGAPPPQGMQPMGGMGGRMGSMGGGGRLTAPGIGNASFGGQRPAGFDGSTVGYAGNIMGQFMPPKLHYQPPRQAPNVMRMMRTMGSISRPPMMPHGGYDGQIFGFETPMGGYDGTTVGYGGFPFYPGGGPNTPNSGGTGVGTGGGGSVGLGGTGAIGGASFSGGPFSGSQFGNAQRYADTGSVPRGTAGIMPFSGGRGGIPFGGPGGAVGGMGGGLGGPPTQGMQHLGAPPMPGNFLTATPNAQPLGGMSQATLGPQRGTGGMQGWTQNLGRMMGGISPGGGGFAPRPMQPPAMPMPNQGGFRQPAPPRFNTYPRGMAGVLT